MASVKLKNEESRSNCKQTEECFIHGDYDITHVHFILDLILRFHFN